MMGKARVAPLKVVTVPRLELAAAVLASQIGRMLKKELELILTNSDRLHHCFEIHSEWYPEISDLCGQPSVYYSRSDTQWRHRKTALNPADSGSRAMRAETFLREGHWLKGPDFMMQPETNWPMLPEVPLVLSNSDPEIKKAAVIFPTTALQNQCPLICFIEHFSSWDKLIRSAAWLLKFKGSLRHLSLQKKANHSLDTSVKSDLAGQKLSV